MAGCCEREGPGHPVAAPPIRAMNPRRFKLIELHFVAATQGRSAEYRIGRGQSGGVRTILRPVLRCAFSPMSELGLGRVGQSRKTSKRANLVRYTPDYVAKVPKCRAASETRRNPGRQSIPPKPTARFLWSVAGWSHPRLRPGRADLMLRRLVPIKSGNSPWQ